MIVLDISGSMDVESSADRRNHHEGLEALYQVRNLKFVTVHVSAFLLLITCIRI